MAKVIHEIPVPHIKRFYVPGFKAHRRCPECRAMCVVCGEADYFSYGAPREFFCECGAEFGEVRLAKCFLEIEIEGGEE